MIIFLYCYLILGAFVMLDGLIASHYDREAERAAGGPPDEPESWPLALLAGITIVLLWPAVLLSERHR